MLVDRRIREDEQIRHDQPGWPAPIPEPESVDESRENNPEGRDLRQEAEHWISSHVEDYNLLCQRALSRFEKGLPLNVSLLAEWMRLGSAAAVDPVDGYKLNNNHRAYIARRMVADFPQLEKCFRFRKTRY